MAGSYLLELELLGNYSVDMPTFEIWRDGSLFGSYPISSTGTSLSVSIGYGGALPASLEFRFNDASGEGGRTIEIQSVKINDQYVNSNNYLTSDSLTNGGSSTVDVTSSTFLFDATDPGAAIFTTGATKTYTGANETYNDYDNSTDQIFNMLGGRDVAYLGAGDDTVSGGAGNDILRGKDGNDLLSGELGDDRIYGDNGADTLYGGSGNDRIHGGDGNDKIFGGADNDALNGNDGNDIILGGTGDDRLNGGGGTDYLFGGDDNDILTGAAGNDTLDGGDGDDTAFGGAGLDFINGGDGNDLLIGNDGNDVIRGDDGNDTIYGLNDNDDIHGGNGNDYLMGHDGDDTINGGVGTDTIIGGSGADIINGGDGADTIHGHGLTPQEIKTILDANPDVIYNADTHSFYEYVTSATNIIAALSNASTSTLNGVAGHLVNITSATEDTFITTLVGTQSVWIGASDRETEGVWKWLDGAESDVNFYTGAVGGTVIGQSYTNWNTNEPNDFGAGEDYAEYRGSTSVWNDQGSGSRRYVIEWDAGLINDDDAIDTINGGSGNDTIYGHGGDDILDGGGNDDIVLGGTGSDIVRGGAGADLVHGQEGNDTIYGDGGNDSLQGGAGDDVLIGGAGNDDYDGGTGIDVADFSAHTTYVTVDLSLAGQNNTRDGLDSFINVENLIGTDFNDNLRGEIGVNTIWGGIGNDAIYGYGGADTLYGEAGSDDFWVSGTDAYGDTFDGGADFDEIQLSAAANFSLAETYISIERLDMNGNEIFALLNDGFDFSGMVLTGRANMNGDVGNETMTGTESRDDIYGLAGDDTINGGGGGDYLYGGDDNDIINGDTGNDRLYGGSGVDTINGGENDDYIYGEDGADILNGGNGNDDFWYQGTEGYGDQVDGGPSGYDEIQLLADSYFDLAATFTNIDRLDMNGFDIYALNNDGFDFSGMTVTARGNMYGDVGNETMSGTESRDDIYGRAGNDIINGNAGGDYLYGEEGTDTLNGGDGGDFLYGGDDNDTLNGDSGNDRLYGGNGVDTINGGANDDYIYGEDGADILNGGDGNDDFWYQGTEGYGDQVDGGPAAGYDEIQLLADSYFDLAATFTNIDRLDMNGFDIYALNNDGFDFSGMTNTARGNMFGDVGNETMTGTESRDDIYGLAGQDIINGGDGGDRLYGGDDNDTINGDSGNDYIYGGNGVDTINGGIGSDYIYGEDGADIMNGGDGNDDFWIGGTEGLGDIINGGVGYDEIQLTADSTFNLAATFTNIDRLDMNTFDVYAINNDGFDFSGMTVTARGDMFGDVGNETMSGTESRDDIYGLAGDDTINGNAGGDYLYGGDGVDTINGGADGDRIYGGVGADILNGDAGSDDFFISGTDGIGDQYNGGADYDEIILQSNIFLDLTTTFTQMERVIFGGFTITANIGTGFDLSGMTRSGTSLLYGQGGDENISGTISNDTIYGLAGSDTLNGNAGNDAIYGGADADILNGGDGNDSFYVSGSESLGDAYDGGAGTDYVRMTADSSFNSANTFTNLTAIINGGFDMLLDPATIIDLSSMNRSGGGGIIGSASDDTIVGFANSNIIRGGAGADTITGGTGNDNFYVSGTDSIGDSYDGLTGTDYIRLEADSYFSSANVFTNITAIINGNFDMYLEPATTIDLSSINRSGNGEIIGSSSADTIIGFANSNLIRGGEGADIMTGGTGGDSFYVSGTEGLGDVYNGGAGNDYIRLEGNTEFNSATSFSSIYAIDFNLFDIQLAAGTTIDFTGILRSDTGNIQGSSIADTITGMDNRDYMYGNDGNDTLIGGIGGDFIYGGNGSDIIYGGEDLDYMYGEAGADTFVFENAFAFNDVDRIYDFSTVEADVLDIQDLLSGYTFGVDDLTDFVQIVDSGAHSLVRVDTTGTADFTAPQIVTLYGINGLTDEVALETAGTLITH